MSDIKTSVNWPSLRQAYGSAEKIPLLLSNHEWKELWDSLCHQGTIYSASLAAIPYLLEISSSNQQKDRAEALRLMSAILVSTEWSGLPAATPEVVSQYHSSFSKVGDTLLSAIHDFSDDQDIYIFLAAIAAINGKAKIGYNLLHANDQIVCPNCESFFPRYYDFDEAYNFNVDN